jgi:hypothetical protein
VAHTEVVRATSGLIRDELREFQKDGKACELKLRDQRPETFLVYLEFCILNEIHLRDIPEDHLQGLDRKSEQFHRLYECWNLGYKMRDNAFCDAIVDAWFDLRSSKFHELGLATIIAVFQNSPPACEMQHLVASELAFGLATKKLDDRVLSNESCYPQICIAIAEALSAKVNALESKHRCNYHRHQHTPLTVQPMGVLGKPPAEKEVWTQELSPISATPATLPTPGTKPKESTQTKGIDDSSPPGSFTPLPLPVFCPSC